jgi:formate hydrogenlyase subunit 3/multisubunit Na+/H+ antiporter MnhD subunit
LRTAMGCGTAIISFIVMLLLLAVAIQITYRGDPVGYYSSNFYIVLLAAPLLLVVSVVAGLIAAASGLKFKRDHR